MLGAGLVVEGNNLFAQEPWYYTRSRLLTLIWPIIFVVVGLAMIFKKK